MALDGQFSRHHILCSFIGSGDAGRYETDARIVLDIEVGLFPQVFIPLIVARIDLGGIQADIETAVRQLSGVEADLSLQAATEPSTVKPKFFIWKVTEDPCSDGVYCWTFCERFRAGPTMAAKGIQTNQKIVLMSLVSDFYVRANPTLLSS